MLNTKGNQSWIFIGRTDTEAETPVLWPPDANNWFIGKDPDAGKDWGQEEKGVTENEMVGWHHWLDGHESDQAPSVGDGLGSLACCSPWSCEVRHDWATELNWAELIEHTTPRALMYTVDSVMMICPCRFIGCDRCTSWCRALLMGKAVLIWRQSMQETSLHSLLKVSVVQRLL